MTLINRYMSAVAQYLPADRRDEITRELRANILDRLEHMQEQTGSASSDADISAVLSELGHPQRVARGFLPPDRLVSEEFFPQFKETLYYVLIIFFIIHVVKVGAVFLQEGRFSFSHLIFGFTDTALLIFASVTAIFYALSNPPVGKSWFTPYANWTPEKLPPAQQPWQKISFGEQASELALNLFLLLVLHYSLWAPVDSLSSLSVTFAAPVLPWIPWMTLLVMFSMLLNFWNFRFNYWSRRKLFVSGLINLGAAVILFCVSRLPEIMVLTPGAEMRVWGIETANQSTAVSLLIVSLWLLYEAGKDFYRMSLLSSTAAS